MNNFPPTTPASTAIEHHYFSEGQAHPDIQQQLHLQLQQEQFQHTQHHQAQEVQTHLMQVYLQASVDASAQLTGALTFAHCSLREILRQYADKPDLLQLVLDAKIAEDNRVCEAERRAAEKLILESRLLDLEIVREQRRIGVGYSTPIADDLYTSRVVIDSYGALSGLIPGSTTPSKSTSLVGAARLSAIGTPTNLHRQTTVLQNTTHPANRLIINSTLANRASSQPLRTPRQFPSPPKKRGSSQLDSKSDNGLEPIYQESTAKKRGRSLSHAEVMEALRNKIRAKNSLGGEITTVPSDNGPEKSAMV
ncbi:hypothetical protein K493DRAFT_312700 [Basidiobolus meristosporus CBS 931.73]|uniref:Uncharacterized protein n=1 Tax=Basidiobolus meristosporus CBS 931.73 TaxID=1314790 RepID=A0A1Y1YRZ4_9FUNG|nr:hypothetical protein K493DRAFT_312700 [Basidiobolus meristosporus CBS 931.73]|eukprot:ORY00801.1 hypothetical protein K493DRAFT_312700 [Basidiobolus meristosporus CBS 931.73]